uniref:RRM domain-containing protein n=1 Tax=Vitis vinifera TaxID=29760 RepID=A5ATR5_VITVI|nr:hypothetical protein VITISV_029873 [Vitis vinifera]
MMRWMYVIGSFEWASQQKKSTQKVYLFNIIYKQCLLILKFSMATSLDMSLDDIIKRSNSERVRGRGRARRGRGPIGGSFNGGRMSGIPPRRGPLRSSRRTKIPWQHDLFEDSLRAAGLPGLEAGTKLYISNLDYGVTNEDIRELFSEIGDIKRYAVHYEKNGRPSGSAEVVYTRRSDAFAAVKRYNNVLLDGKPMKIEIIGSDSDMPVSARVNVIGGVNGKRRRTVVMTPGVGHARGSTAINRSSREACGNLKVSQGLAWVHVISSTLEDKGRNLKEGGLRRGAEGVGCGRRPMASRRGRGGLSNGRGRGRAGSRGRGRGRGRKQPVEKSAVELDKELDNYHAEAMHT